MSNKDDDFSDIKAIVAKQNEARQAANAEFGKKAQSFQEKKTAFMKAVEPVLRNLASALPNGTVLTWATQQFPYELNGRADIVLSFDLVNPKPLANKDRLKTAKLGVGAGQTQGDGGDVIVFGTAMTDGSHAEEKARLPLDDAALAKTTEKLREFVKYYLG